MKNLFLIVLLSCIVTISTSAQKIFPNAVGFGTDSRGAYAGSSAPTILTVDTVYAGSLQTGTNSGSLEWCLSENYPRIIVFKVGGVIDYSNTSTRKITVNDPYVNIYGQTAPSPGITLFSCGIYIETHDILMQHLKIRLGDHPKPDGSVYVTDCLAIMDDNGGENIVIDHCSLSWSQDELLSCYAPDVTISNCLIYDPLAYSAHANESGDHEPEQHGYGPLVPMYEGNFTFMRNFIGWTTYRNPAYDAVTLVHANNFTYTYSYRQTEINGSKGKSLACLIGNVSYPTPGRNSNLQQYSCFFTESVPIDSRIFLDDNLCIRKEDGYSDLENAYLQNWTSQMESTILVTSSASTGLDLSEYRIMPSAMVEQYIQDSVGAFYWDRDEYDVNAMSRLTSRVDDYINSPVDLPARAYNADPYYGDRIDGGDMSSGYDFSSNPVNFTVNGTTISLNQNLTSQSAVLSALNSQLPAGTEAVDHPHELCEYIIIQTTAKGSNTSLTISGDDANVFGITTGTYYGSDGYIGYPQSVQVSGSLNIPSSPHNDDDNDGYTNIEEWAYGIPDNNTSVDTTASVDTSIIQVAYVTYNRTMDSTASVVTNDTIIRLLEYDDNFDVTVFAVAGDSVINLSGYDIAVVQESFSSTADILKPTGSVGLANINIPFIYNKVYALQDGKAVDNGGGTSRAISGLAITVDSINRTNELFNGITFTDNKFDVFYSTASNLGGVGTAGLNYTYGLSLSDSLTLLGTASEITDITNTIFVNDLDSGTQIGSEVINARMIAFGMNFGAISADNGCNITNEGITLWRNAFYSLGGLNIPTVPVSPSPTASVDTSIIQVAYVTYNRTMDSTASVVTNDTIIRLLEYDDNFDVTVFAVAGDSVINLSGYDIAVVQESFSSTADILKPTGSVGLANINIPFIYNKVYALQDGKAVDTGGGTSGAISGLAITVDSINQTNELFNGITFTDNKFDVFYSTASNLGGVGTAGLNYTYGLSLSDSLTLIGTASEITDITNTIFVNDLDSGTQIGSEVINARMIAFGMNFGAISADNGCNITNEGITLWRNAFYSLAGLNIPTALSAFSSTSFSSYTHTGEFLDTSVKVYPNPVNDKLIISANKNISNISIYNLTGYKILDITPLNNETQINFKQMLSGTYIVKIQVGNKLEQHKVIKQ